jgi:hypothetical protein
MGLNMKCLNFVFQHIMIFKYFLSSSFLCLNIFYFGRILRAVKDT